MGGLGLQPLLQDQVTPSLGVTDSLSHPQDSLSSLNKFLGEEWGGGHRTASDMKDPSVAPDVHIATPFVNKLSSILLT